MRRLAKELLGLSQSLPLSASSSVFVRYDEDRLSHLQALVTGPRDTPYANGCFLFDLHVPHDYPQSSPRCRLLTTGQGQVRFGPNLYADGKVCLSLLGTWEGPGWDPAHSSIMQILVSIQGDMKCVVMD